MAICHANSKLLLFNVCIEFLSRFYMQSSLRPRVFLEDANTIQQEVELFIGIGSKEDVFESRIKVTHARIGSIRSNGT